MLEWIGFWTPASGKPCPVEEQLASEDELASLAGKFALCFVGARMVRAVWLLRGWPHRSLMILAGGQKAQETVSALRADWEAYQHLLTLAATGNPRAKMLAQRSVMALTSVRQLCEALLRSPAGPWQLFPEFLEWLAAKQKRLVSSLICEDAFNCQKNNNIVKGRRKYMRPQKASCLLLREQVSLGKLFDLPASSWS